MIPIPRDQAQIWKYVLPEIPGNGLLELELPINSQVLTFSLLPQPIDERGAPREKPALWVLFDKSLLGARGQTRRFVAVGTGQPFPAEPEGSMRYVGSAPLRRDFDVLFVHLFELGPGSGVRA